MFKQNKIYKIILFRPEIYEFFLSFFRLILPLIPFTLKVQSAVAS